MFATKSRCNTHMAFKAAPVAPRPARAVSRAQTVVVKAELKVGDKLSESSEYYRVIKTSDGRTVSFASFKGKAMVLFFYPKASTPGCTKEACKFRDEYSAFTSAGVEVFGISADAPEANAAFAQANNLPYALLTDPNSIIRKTFGIKSDLFGVLPGRQTFVFDKDSKCIMSFNDQLNAEQHVAEAIKALRAAKVIA